MVSGGLCADKAGGRKLEGSEWPSEATSHQTIFVQPLLITLLSLSSCEVPKMNAGLEKPLMSFFEGKM